VRPVTLQADKHHLFFNRFPAILALAAIVAGCAEIGAPPGGEIDRTGARLLYSIPADSSTGVPPGRTVEIVFNEKIVKPAQPGALFISPRPAADYRVSWKSDRAIIELQDDFLPDQTYVVTVAASLTDLRNNKLDSAISIAFSTGDQLDSGRVSGGVLTPKGDPMPGWLVGLYRHLDPTDLLVIDSILPDYLTTTGRDGRFSFRNLPDALFLLVAFEDKNRDELFAATSESFAVADRRVDLKGDLRVTDLIATTGNYDTLAPRLSSVSRTKSGLLEIHFDRPVDAGSLRDRPETIVVSTYPTDTARYEACGILEDQLDEVSAVTVSVGPLQDGLYRITADLALVDQLVLDSARITPFEDKTPPTVLHFRPGEGRYFAGQVDLGLTFSEPIDTSRISATSFLLWEDSLRTLPLEHNWPDCFRLSLIPPPLTGGHKYRLEMMEFDVADQAGNDLGDSLKSYSFSTHDADSLGSITGNLRILLSDRSDYPAVIDFRQADGKQTERIIIPSSGNPMGDSTAGRPFNITVPPGKYLISGFMDGNNDGRPTPGFVKPYRLGETRFFYPDTVAVRARFETGGLDLVVD
jgi:hypothetical protein